MTCRELEADVVDLARGIEIGADAAARLGRHLDRCPACTARLARERQLTAALRAVAGAEPPSARAAAIEAELVATFNTQRAAATRQLAAPRPALARPHTRAWLAAAAVLVLAVAAWQASARWPSPGERAGAVGPGTARSGPLPKARPAPGASDQVLQFVALPTAVGLPALESGRIVRVEVPTAELPAYGFVMEPQPAGGAVEADVLVGQDGEPRAIRFVTAEADSRRPQ